MDEYSGVSLPQGREVLTSFGGTVTIEQYRKGFHIIHDYENIQRNFKGVDDIVRVREHALQKHCKCWGFQYLHYAGPDASYTTFVNILPLTNRTFDKKTLVTTGNETNIADTQALTGKEGGGAKTSSKNKAPRASSVNHRSRSSKIQPVAISSSVRLPEREEPLPSSDAGPLHRAFRQTSTQLMTTEEVLACNDEQQFYTNSLRGYGNILTSMGIGVTRLPQK